MPRENDSWRAWAPIAAMTMSWIVATGSLPHPGSAVQDLTVGKDTLPDWLAGYWVGEGFGGTVEELWTPRRADTMAGTFRLTVARRVQLYEFMTLTVTEGHPVIRVKHFNADGSPWEDSREWVEFPFERLSRRGIYFDGLSYELVDDATLRVRVAVGHSDGRAAVEELVLRRVR